ncbi:MAG: hypothetical protein RBU37_00875 [Myxococcota bacterium]|nr:hypothetical protein [Myxococcota bacterium]
MAKSRANPEGCEHDASNKLGEQAKRPIDKKSELSLLDCLQDEQY